MVSWKKQQEALYDKEQCKLNPDLTISRNDFKFAKKQSKGKFDDIVLCPFCLNPNRLDRFIVKKGLRVCPNCEVNMKTSTLTELDSLDKFTLFIFNYRLNGFWNKVCLDIKQKVRDARFNEWNKRLEELGLNTYFWKRYKDMRGDIEYED